MGVGSRKGEFHYKQLYHTYRDQQYIHVYICIYILYTCTQVTMLQRGHIVRIEVEYQYTCSCDDTNVCVSYCEDQCPFPPSNYICVCTGPIGYKYRQRLTVDVRTYGEYNIQRLGRCLIMNRVCRGSCTDGDYVSYSNDKPNLSCASIIHA